MSHLGNDNNNRDKYNRILVHTDKLLMVTYEEIYVYFGHI